MATTYAVPEYVGISAAWTVDESNIINGINKEITNDNVMKVFDFNFIIVPPRML